MNQIFVRPVEPEDAAQFLEWQKSNENFDPAAVMLDGSFTLAAFDAGGVIAYLPVQHPQVLRPLMLESIAYRPGASDLIKARAVKELIKGLITIGYMEGTGELLFFGDSEQMNALAENHLFERVDWPVYRLRLADLKK